MQSFAYSYDSEERESAGCDGLFGLSRFISFLFFRFPPATET